MSKESRTSSTAASTDPVRQDTARKALRETDLYPPVVAYLNSQGYTVRAEVRQCDVTAVKADELIVVELKRQFTIDLLVQVTKRQRITPLVYVAIPRPLESLRTAKWRGIFQLLRRLEVGLLFVILSNQPDLCRAEVAFHPSPFHPRKSLQERRAVTREFSERSGDYNLGGMMRTTILTAYREQAIHIACCLETHGPLSIRALKALGTSDKTASILQSDYYGWFARVHRGTYALRPKANKDLEKFTTVTDHYRKIVATMTADEK